MTGPSRSYQDFDAAMPNTHDEQKKRVFHKTRPERQTWRMNGMQNLRDDSQVSVRMRPAELIASCNGLEASR